MAAQIAPGQIAQDVRNQLHNDPGNPGRCACGVYIYYSAVCGHVFEFSDFKCGTTITRALKPAFCKTPTQRRTENCPSTTSQCHVQPLLIPSIGWVSHSAGLRIFFTSVISANIAGHTRHAQAVLWKRGGKGIWWRQYWKWRHGESLVAWSSVSFLVVGGFLDYLVN
jgi:hypothetical protein